MNQDSILKNLKGRVIGLDCHPDSFTAAILNGRTPAEATVEKTFNKVPLTQLASWAAKNTTSDDAFALEASGNSFHIARKLLALDRKAEVLESCHLGKLKEAHANNDKISAVRIGKAYLAGTAKAVWIPDLQTQQRRDCSHLYRKTVKRFTQTSNRLDSYLSDNGVRLEESLAGLDQAKALAVITAARPWDACQLRILQGLLLEYTQAQEQRRHWESTMAAEVATDPVLLSLTRLCGVRDVVAYTVGAVVGDIQRFASPKKLVKYVGLNPAFDQSGEGHWSGGIGGHGHKYLRSLLIESAHAILRTKNALAKWGQRLQRRKGSPNIAVAAVARKLVVAIWYLLNGQWEQLQDIDKAQSLKIGKIITKVGKDGLKALDKTRAGLRTAMEESLKTGRIYRLKPVRTMDPKAPPKPSLDAVPA